MLLAIFVDDSAAVGPDLAELESEMYAILDKYPGKVVPPKKVVGGVEYRDLLGATLQYDRRNRFMKITCEYHIEK